MLGLKMNPFITEDRTHYCRWINVLPGFLIPGSAQFLSGRRRAAVIWFALSLMVGLCILLLLVNPRSDYSIEGFHWFDVVCWAFQISMLADACRRRIPRIGLKGWSVFLGVFLLLALGPALVIRQFFVQPFKIPTGAMQPTLYGLTIRTPSESTTTNPRADIARPGEEFLEVRTTVSGRVDARHTIQGDSMVFYVSGTPHRVKRGLKLFFSPGDNLAKGQTMAAGFVKQGDHILVSKAAYWFKQPQRGDIVVFSTDGVNSPLVRKHTCFVKRIVGLPGETISLEPPYIIANGSKLLEPPILRKISEGLNGYAGYSFATPTSSGALLTTPEDRLALGADEYLLFGDNTKSSLDGRYFGPIKRSFIIGKVFLIYAPADRKGQVE
jgi:signal peptidase I